MTEFEMYQHGSRGNRKLIVNYEGEVTVENAYIEDAIGDFFGELKTECDSLENQHILAFICENYASEIADDILDMGADEIRDTDIRNIEERRVKGASKDFLEETE